MMSYLWILLLGSLLAGSAKAQDDVAPTEDTAAPEAHTTPELEADEGSDHMPDHIPEEIRPTVDEPEPTVDPEVEAHEPGAEQVTPADEGAEPVTPTDEGAEPVTPAADTETEAAADTETEAAADTEAEAAADTEAEAAATTQEPAADTEAEELTPSVEEQPTSSTEAPPAQEEEEDGPEGEATPAADPAVPDNEEEPTDAAADAEPTNPVVEEEIVADVEKGVALAPTVKVETLAPKVDLDAGFNLEDALSEGNAVDNPSNQGKSRSFGSNAHAAEATGDADQPKVEEASSGSVAGILCAVAVVLVGAVAGYFTYQKKKLCFKDRQEADPEAARKADAVEAQSDPQVLSNLLNSS